MWKVSGMCDADDCGPCQKCLDCEANRDCTEHSRLCFAWKQPASTYVEGSVVTGVSSICNLVDYDMTHYKEMLDKLGDASVDIEATLDDFPVGSEQHRNDRYSKTRRDRDLAHEDEQMMRIKVLLNRHQEQSGRLDDVESDDGEVQDDAIPVTDEGMVPEAAATQPSFGLTSQTMTHYTFEQLLPSIGLGAGLGEARDPDPLPDVFDLDDGQGPDGGMPIDVEAALQNVSLRTPAASPPRKAAVKVTAGTGAIPRTVTMTTPTSVFFEPTRAGPGRVTPPGSSGGAVGGHARPVTPPPATIASDPPRVKTPERILEPATVCESSVTSAGPAIVSAATPSINTSTTAATASSIMSPTEQRTGRERLRSASEGDRRSGGTEDKLGRLKLLVATQTQKASQDLSRLLNRVREYSGTTTRWIDDELRHLQGLLDRLEEMESQIWMKTAAIRGKPAQQKRLSQWKEWQARQTDKIRQVQTLVWAMNERPREGAGEGSSRRYGHVEKVRLPQFSGKLEDFSEFKVQFRELCRGEGYTPVVELAQMKLKLPREAITAIAGLQCPSEAWKRLEEVYGNRELSILSSLKRLREFKSSKTPPHEQVIELASALQRCRTELSNLDAVQELMGDREALACLVQALPPTIRDKWYDREVPSSTVERGSFCLPGWRRSGRTPSGSG